MSKRKIYTRTGDRGETSLVGGKRVSKDSARIECFGQLDELNSFLGLALSELGAAAGDRQGAAELQELRHALTWIQHKLFDVGATLATPRDLRTSSVPSAGADDVRRLERLMDRWSDTLPTLESFVLPGGGRPGACLHVARAICRRAEIQVLKLSRNDGDEPEVLTFLNRLSDFLFLAARQVAHALGEPEVLWSPSSSAPGDSE